MATVKTSIKSRLVNVYANGDLSGCSGEIIEVRDASIVFRASSGNLPDLILNDNQVDYQAIKEIQKVRVNQNPA